MRITSNSFKNLSKQYFYAKQKQNNFVRNSCHEIYILWFNFCNFSFVISTTLIDLRKVSLGSESLVQGNKYHLHRAGKKTCYRPRLPCGVMGVKIAEKVKLNKNNSVSIGGCFWSAEPSGDSYSLPHRVIFSVGSRQKE